MNGMISRRKFISMTMMMVVLLFMFQFSQAVKDMGNDYNVNPYARASQVDGDTAWQPVAQETEDVSIYRMKERDYVAFLGSTDNQLGSIVRQWCVYTKRDWKEYASVAELTEIKRKKPEVLLIDSGYVNFRTEADDLLTLAEMDISMVFCNLPDAQTIKQYKNVRELLGIQQVEAEEVELKGIKLFSGFLLGGETVYQIQEKEDEERQDLDMTIPWYVAFGGTKTYMVGVLEDEAIENEYLPAIIWRNSHGDGKIFAVNGDYMYDTTGIGILDAMMAELHSYELYPVINAQNLTIANFPGFAAENTDRLMAVYSRNARGLFQDIMWPAIMSISGKTENKDSVFFMAQGDYTDENEPSDKDYIFYLKELKEQEGEAGVSLEIRSEGLTAREKVERDAAFFDEANDGYLFSAGYAGSAEAVEQIQNQLEGVKALENLKTLVQKYDAQTDLVSYLEEDILVQNTTSDGCNYTFTQDLRMRSLQTALGYSNILLDMYCVAWPEDGEDSWEKVYDGFSRNINTFWRPFGQFDKTTISESNERARNMLALDFADRREGDIIYVQVENLKEEAWFILRIHGEEIEEISGAQAYELEEGAYLLQITEPIIRIQLKDAEGPYYYAS